MKKSIIALMALAGVAAAEDYTMQVLADVVPVSDYEITADDNLYAGAFTLTFVIEEGNAVSGDYDIIAAYYQVNNGNGYTVNAFQLNSDGSLSLNRGKDLSSTTLANDTTTGTQDKSIFTNADGTYTLAAGTYTIEYLGGTNGSAAADLYLNGVKVAGFTKGSHNMNGDGSGSLALNLTTNDSYKAAMVPEPATATLSLLALAGLAARRRRK
ncbi:MAG: PEP-CTERM sorting domain-containing protein [Akkermansia sp.]|nr:PEP-CTERM sorting domain-containing protein [Akkermansia sp.]